MLDWDSIKKEYEVLSEQLTDSSLDKRKRAELQKKSSQHAELIRLHDEISSLEESIKENENQLGKSDEEMKELFAAEIGEQKSEVRVLRIELDEILYPADPKDKKSVFLEIRAGAGGQEAALFAQDLFKMYSNYALLQNWQFSVVSASETEIGGFKEIVLYIKGKRAYKFLKFESGVHRVQRVPKTEGSGRVHTSTVTVAVLPEVDDVDIDINPSDLRIDVYRASGAGGQHVNTTDSAVRILHIPTGVVVTCQDERSQIKNKARAMKVLKSRIVEAEERKKMEEITSERKKQIGTGERSEKIRTYNFPQNRVTDHRINLNLKKLDIVIQGNLEDLLGPLLEWDLMNRKKQQEESLSSK